MVMNKNINISLFFDNGTLSAKAFGMFILSVLLLLLTGCESNKVEEEDSPDSNVTMTLKAGTDPDFMSNASIYVFTHEDKFVEKKLNVTVNDNKLSTYMPAGNWNLVLLSCKSSLEGKISLPLRGGDKSTPMWKTEYTNSSNEFLSQTPAELRYASLPNTIITENSVTTKSATLSRNVAKIQVILENYTGFDQIYQGRNDYAFVDLLDVPTTLDWTGGYYPGKNTPEHSGDVPIREYFNFNTELKADIVDFIIPAHRGIDENDVTDHKLRLRISMPQKGKSFFGKTPVKIASIPRVNGIIQLYVTFRGEPDTNLDIKVKVKDWVDVDQEVTFE
jgi:hypothetical protein